MHVNQKITPCLWFDDQAEEAIQFYTAIFRNSKIVTIARYGEAGHNVHGKPAGTVMTVAFELDGQAFTALNGGPMFKFNEAISFQVNCETQEEVDYYWEKLSEGGDEKAQQCGWLKDKYGVSWQVVPGVLIEMINDPDSDKSQRTMEAMLQMKKIDIDELKRGICWIAFGAPESQQCCKPPIRRCSRRRGSRSLFQALLFGVGDPVLLGGAEAKAGASVRKR